MNLAAAVFDCYGCRIPEVPADGKMKSFPIDQFRIGFLMNFGDVYIFGCWSDGDIYYFDTVEWHGLYHAPAKPEKQRLNRMIIECAKGLVARGEVLSASDSARLKFAVQQVEASS